MHKYIILLFSLFAFLTSCVHEDDEVVERVAVGDTLPAFCVTVTVPASDGVVATTYRYDSTEPGASVIVFFNSSCTDCQQELPRLDARYKAGEFVGRRIVCVSRAEEESSVAAYWQAEGFTLPYSAQSDRSIFDQFASAGIPRIYYTDDSGKVVKIDK